LTSIHKCFGLETNFGFRKTSTRIQQEIEKEIKIPSVVIQCVKDLFILGPMRPANNPLANGVIKAIKLNSYTDLFS